jgi:hypothetical protein
MMTYQCHNPACRRPVRHADAFLRSVLLERVAFCSRGCVTMFDQLDKVVRSVPAQREPVDVSSANERMGA